MHAYIFELSSRKTEESCWATEENFYDDNEVDYTRQLIGHERDEAIEFLMNSIDFEIVFKKLSPYSMASTSLFQLRNQWIEKMQSVLDVLRDGRGFGSYSLIYAAECPVFGSTRFCIPDWCGEASCSPSWMLDWLATFPTGTQIYINSVFDYHY